jgi:TATA-binding protein-associated factor Taf7
MMALTGKSIKDATIEDLRRIEEHIKEYRAKMDSIDNPIAKGYFQMDIDISEKTRELIIKELEL